MKGLPSLGWGLAAKILGPAVIIGALMGYHRWAVSAAETRGEESRQAEIDTLTADLTTMGADFTECRKMRLKAETEAGNLNRKLVAQADENAKALVRQAEQFTATQDVTIRSMETLARNTRSSEVDFAAIIKELKGVEYDYDQNTGRCIIRGGGLVLRDSARGKSNR